MPLLSGTTVVVHQAGGMIREVTDSVEQVNELLGVIAVASREQSVGLEAINKALMQLQGATQQNAALVQQAAYAAVTFKDEAAELSGLVGRFQTDSDVALERRPGKLEVVPSREVRRTAPR